MSLQSACRGGDLCVSDGGGDGAHSGGRLAMAGCIMLRAEVMQYDCV